MVFVFVLTIFTVFYSSSSIICQDSILDVSPTETETKRSVSTVVAMYTFRNNWYIRIILPGAL